MTTTTILPAVTPKALARLAREERSRLVLNTEPHAAELLPLRIECSATRFIRRYATVLVRGCGTMRGYPTESAIDWIACRSGKGAGHAREVLCALLDRGMLRLEVTQ